MRNCPTGKSNEKLSSLRSKNIALVPSGKSLLLLRPSCPREGRWPSSRTLGGMRWTLLVLKTSAPISGRRSRVVLMPRRWHQPAADADASRRGWWQESPITRESAKEAVKTIAQGRPGTSGKPVVTNLRVFYFYTQGCGCVARPAFPAPSALRGTIPAQLGHDLPREYASVPGQQAGASWRSGHAVVSAGFIGVQFASGHI